MRVLLHICCGVCAAGVVERLRKDGHSVAGYFFNPNIYPEVEYVRRLETVRSVAKKVGFDLVEGVYDHEKWRFMIAGFEAFPEGGSRCRECYKMRLRSAYIHFLRSGDFDLFTSTLTVSPHKDSKIVNEIGKDIGGESFFAADFKKKEGFKRTIELAKEWGLYRQSYCGCEFSV